jgi:hypothetical protein
MQPEFPKFPKGGNRAKLARLEDKIRDLRFRGDYRTAKPLIIAALANRSQLTCPR